jgi:hypothetical protein
VTNKMWTFKNRFVPLLLSNAGRNAVCWNKGKGINVCIICTPYQTER